MSDNLDLNVFTNVTKKVCLCSFISMFLIMLFILSPLSKFIKTSAFMKIVIIILLIYTIYLNHIQTNSLKNVNTTNKNAEIVSQYSVNIIGSYVFTLFLALLIMFVFKSFF